MKLKKAFKWSAFALAGMMALATPLTLVSCGSSSSNGGSNDQTNPPAVQNVSYDWLAKVTSEVPNRKAGTEFNTPELEKAGKGEKAASKWIKSTLTKMGYKENATTASAPVSLKAGQVDGTTTNAEHFLAINNIEEAQQTKDVTTPGFYELSFAWWNEKTPDTKNASQTIGLNINSTKEGIKAPKDFYLVSHYDTANVKNDGTNDNSSGLAMNLAIAEYYSKKENTDKLNYNLHILFPGAEEVGVRGTWAWSQAYLTNKAVKDNIYGMINLDSVAGGDILYVHSPDSRDGKVAAGYNVDPMIRNEINKQSPELLLHPQIDAAWFKKGETGDWSDHAPFYKNGVPVAYIESTNFNIKGEDGYDGYSQVTNPRFWKKNDGTQVVLNESTIDDVEGNKVKVFIPQDYDALVKDKTFTSWGKLWHMDDDVFATYQEWAPGRLQTQMSVVYAALMKYLVTLNPTK